VNFQAHTNWPLEPGTVVLVAPHLLRILIEIPELLWRLGSQIWG